MFNHVFHVFVTNVAMIQPRNGYNQYYFSLDSTVLEAKLARPRSGRGRGQNFGLEALTPLQCILFNSRLPDVVNVRVQFETRQLNDARLSSLHCRAYITKYFIKKGSKVYCAFVDASKAFDKVLHNGSFVKLLKKNVSLIGLYIFLEIGTEAAAQTSSDATAAAQYAT